MSSINYIQPLFTIPPEIRQHILILATGDLCPLSLENAQLLVTVPRYHRAEHIHGLSRANFTDEERRAYAHFCRLYQVSSTISVDMVRVERIWLTHRLRWPPLSLAQFAAYAAQPRRINGILTLSLFEESFMANPPWQWEDTVRSLGEEPHAARWECEEYMRAWRQVILTLPLNGARVLQIEAVEVVDVGVMLLSDGDEILENQGWVRESVIARFEILLMMRLGLRMGRVRVMRPAQGQIGTVVRMPWN